MVEIRKLPLSEGWVLVPRDRCSRPHDFRLPTPERLPTPCPFCAGREHETPEPLAVYPQAPVPGGNGRGPRATHDAWRVRVVPNKFPAVEPLPPARAAGKRGRPPLDTPAARVAPPPSSLTLEAHAGHGVHEVVIESPRHATQFRQLTRDEALDTVRAYRDRLRAHRADTRLAYSLAFRNSGVTGGASLEHVHSQIIATQWVPATISTELQFAADYHDRRGSCLFCDMARRELLEKQRLVASNRSFVAWCPYASRFAYEVWIAPRQHRADFDASSDHLLNEFTRILRDVVGRVERLPGSPGYNYWIHTSPFNLDNSPSYHWHLEIIPRASYQAAFEWGCGEFINAVSPEDAAALLRELS